MIYDEECAVSLVRDDLCRHILVRVAESSNYGIELSGCIIEEDDTVSVRDYKRLLFT